MCVDMYEVVLNGRTVLQVFQCPFCLGDLGEKIGAGERMDHLVLFTAPVSRISGELEAFGTAEAEKKKWSHAFETMMQRSTCPSWYF